MDMLRKMLPVFVLLTLASCEDLRTILSSPPV